MPKDKPFRELQFSSTQLIVVFLAILVLGVFIFLLGISVGKKQTQLAAGSGTGPGPKTETVAPKNPVPDSAKPDLIADRKTEGEAAAKPADAKPPVETNKPAAKAADEPKGRFYVQVGAGTDKPAAKSFAEKIEQLGFPAAVLDPLATDRKTIFRVRVGPYDSKAEADDAQGKIAQALKKKKADFFIVKD
jgi:cell division protein FtsN